MMEFDSPIRSVQSLRTGTRIKSDGVSRVLYFSKRAVALLFHNRVLTLLNRDGVLLPSSIIVDVETFPHVSEGYFTEDELVLDSLRIILENPVDLSYHETTRLVPHELLAAIHPFLHIKSHSIANAVLRLSGESLPVSGIESRVSNRQFEILRSSRSTADTVRRLLGLGFGLTPSGDDFALGVISILNLSGRDTTDIRSAIESYDYALSRTMLEDALDGYYSEPLFSLVKSISEGLLTHDVFKRVFEVGHSSGSDILAGMYYALKNLDN
jgi:hypothetical protein